MITSLLSKNSAQENPTPEIYTQFLWQEPPGSHELTEFLARWIEEVSL